VILKRLRRSRKVVRRCVSLAKTASALINISVRVLVAFPHFALTPALSKPKPQDGLPSHVTQASPFSSLYAKMAPEAPWVAIARRKQAERQSRIPKAWLLSSLPPPDVNDVRSLPRTSGILTPAELSITESYDATALADAIRSRKVTAEQVTIAFCKRAAIAQQVCNCLTEIFFEDAIERAKFLDQAYERTGKTVGPLHGVPISLKDTFKVKGYDASIGIASLAENPAKENSLLVDILLEQGAVLYCKTNIPQTLMALDSDNNVFGRVLNPRDRRLTAGGSSGGEGALIAMRGSILGVGTDVGGSIRVPAMCNGLYGIKGSFQRVPYVGQENGGREGASKLALPASAGPIAHSVRDCELFLQTISDARPWERDPSLTYGLWEEQGSIQNKPVIGVIRKDDVITPLPPVSKVLDETVQALRMSGVDVVEIDAPAFKKLQSLANKFFGIDGGNFMFDLLEAKGEPLTNWLSTRLRRGKQMDINRLIEIQAQKIQLETEMLKIWKDPKTGRQIDAIICPVAPHPVPPIDRWNGVSYTSSFVLLDYPAGTLPVRDFKKEDLKGELTETKPLGSWDKVNRGLCELNPVVIFKLWLLTHLQGMRRPSTEMSTSTANCLSKSLHHGCRIEGCTRLCRLLTAFYTMVDLQKQNCNIY
jgi:amidase